MGSVATNVGKCIEVISTNNCTQVSEADGQARGSDWWFLRLGRLRVSVVLTAVPAALVMANVRSSVPSTESPDEPIVSSATAEGLPARAAGEFRLFHSQAPARASSGMATFPPGSPTSGAGSAPGC